MSDDGARKPDRSIAGTGELPGGLYGKMAIAGSSSVDSDLEADDIKVAGSGELKGSVKAMKLSSAGSCRIKGYVWAGHINSSGSFDADGDVGAHSVEAAGACIDGDTLRASNNLDFPTLK